MNRDLCSFSLNQTGHRLHPTVYQKPLDIYCSLYFIVGPTYRGTLLHQKTVHSTKLGLDSRKFYSTSKPYNSTKTDPIETYDVPLIAETQGFHLVCPLFHKFVDNHGKMAKQRSYWGSNPGSRYSEIDKMSVSKTNVLTTTLYNRR